MSIAERRIPLRKILLEQHVDIRSGKMDLEGFHTVAVGSFEVAYAKPVLEGQIQFENIIHTGADETLYWIPDEGIDDMS